MTRRHLTLAFVVALAAAWGFLPEFSVTVLSYIGLYALVAAGHLRLDGKRIERDAQPVAPGQVLTLMHRGEIKALRILALPVRRGPPAEAAALVEDANVSHQPLSD